MRQVALLLVAIGCGRFDFDPQARVVDAARDAPLDPSLVAWWRMTALVPMAGDDGVVESTGITMSPATCSTACPVIVTGGHDDLDAAQFDGSATLLAAASAAPLLDQQFTIAAWVFNGAANAGCYMTKGLGSAYFNSWALCNDDGSDNELFFYTCTGSAADMLEPGGQVPAGSWHHVAGTWDGVTKTLYLDGVALGSDQPPGVDYDDDPVYLGGDVDNGAPVSLLPGRLDDVRVYNRALSAAEIAELAAQ